LDAGLPNEALAYCTELLKDDDILQTYI